MKTIKSPMNRLSTKTIIWKIFYATATPSSNLTHAFVWTAHCGVLNLNTVLQSVIPKGWILESATDTSEDGTVITGYGTRPPVPGSRFGQTEPWRAVLPVVCP